MLIGTRRALLVAKPAVIAPVGLALDGSNIGGGGTSTTAAATLTTTGGSGKIVAVVISNAAVSSVTAAALTFTQRSTVTQGANNITTTFTAPYSSNFSGTITANMSASTFCSIVVFGVSGSTAFDSNVSLPFTTSAATGAFGPFSTTSTNAFLFIGGLLPGSSVTFSDSSSASWTIIQQSSADFITTAFRIVSAPVTNLTVNSSGNLSGSIVDAIK